jgi:hypothetical protein
MTDPPPLSFAQHAGRVVEDAAALAARGRQRALSRGVEGRSLGIAARTELLATAELLEHVASELRFLAREDSARNVVADPTAGAWAP